MVPGEKLFQAYVIQSQLVLILELTVRDTIEYIIGFLRDSERPIKVVLALDTHNVLRAFEWCDFLYFLRAFD